MAAAPERPPRSAALLAALGLFLAWVLAAAVTGALSDDGLNAYAARQLLHGRRLYLDTGYHQGPLLPWLLRWWFAVFGVGLGSARAFTALCAVGVAALAERVARVAGAEDEGITWAAWALALSPSLALHLVYVQSHGPATLLALGGVALLLRGGRVPVACGGALLALAVAARVSFVVLFIPAGLYLARTRGPALAASLGALVGLALGVVLTGDPVAAARELYLPFGGGANAPTQYHLALYLATDGPGAALARRVAGWPNQILYYAPLWLAVLVAAGRDNDPRRRLLLGCALWLTIAHGVLPRRINHSYLAVAMPFWAAWAAARGIRRVAATAPSGGEASFRPIFQKGLRPIFQKGLRPIFVAAAVIAGWRGVGRLDVSGGQTVVAEVRRVGQAVAAVVPPDGTLLTFAIEVALAADRDVLPGLERGYFSYYANLPDALTAAAHAVNQRRLLDDLNGARADALLLSERDFLPLASTDYPWPDPAPLWEAVAARYRPVAQFDAVGEKRARLTLYVRR